MPTIPEIVLILKTVTIFLETPTSVLAEVASLVEEYHFAAGETIFHKGDIGTSMYIIVDGRVRVHDGDLTVDMLNKRTVFGEMAALDPEPRSATVTALEPTRLFRLEQHALYQIMQRRSEVVRGVVHVLCQRLRASMLNLLEDFTYIQQLQLVIEAAVAVEAGTFRPERLDAVARRTDELGQLARVFQHMAREIASREQQLKRQVQELIIEVNTSNKNQQVAEITETDYFQELQQKVKEMRRRNKQRHRDRDP